ncbi:MAG: helix-turn-helix domain-containing protein [Gemmataceae bacterium]|nr:helix-turn-helix domain-containing protein [Gemmataceae bacterium]
MSHGLGNFNPEALRHVIGELEFGRKFFARRSRVSLSAVRTWVNGQRSPTRENFERLVHVLNREGGRGRFAAEDFCGEFAVQRVSEKLRTAWPQLDEIRRAFRGVLTDSAEQHARTRRLPRMSTWRRNRVAWTRLPDFLHPTPTAAQPRFSDLHVIPFTVNWLFWHRNLQRQREFSEQFRLTGRETYNEIDLTVISHHLMREQMLLEVAEFEPKLAEEWYRGTTEYAAGNLLDNFTWGKCALQETYGCGDVIGFARHYMERGLRLLCEEFPALRPFLFATP